MMYVEEYEVDPSNLDEIMKMYEDSKQIFKDLDLPFVKTWKIYQSTENPRKILGYVVFNESGTIERFMEEYLKHPMGPSVVERFQRLTVEGSVVTDNYKKIVSL